MRNALLTFLSVVAWAQPPANVIFLEPVDKINTQGAEVTQKMPLLRKAAEQEKYAVWMRNESAERALRLYRAAFEIMHPEGGRPDYYIALVEGGNHAAVGFRLQNGGRIEDLPHQTYILLDADMSRFDTTLLHETGHMAMEMLAGGQQLDGRDFSSIPHSTATLSGRTTAFSEGYAEHLEALAAHLNHDQGTQAKYHRGRVIFGEGSFGQVEYFHPSMDLGSFSQNIARYLDVRDNNFAFESAFREPDYLRVQLEKGRDFATLRDANQLLQSEGFYASFFFLFVVRGAETPAESVIWEREQRILRAMHAMFEAKAADISRPWLPDLVNEYMKLFPEEKTAIVDALNDLSHGVFVDPEAPKMWREHYLATLRLDPKGMNVAGLTALRKVWRNAVLGDPKILYSRLGPEILCIVPGTKVRLVAFEQDEPVQFDLNTVQPGILRLIPGITEPEIAAWLAQRAERPFQSADEFRSRGVLRAPALSALKIGD